MTGTNKQILNRYYEELLNKGNLAVADEILAPDLVVHGVRTLEGRESFLHVLTTVLRTAFPDLTFTTEDVFGDGDKIAARFTMRGTHQAEYLGMAGTGKQIEIEGISILRFAEGKIAETWGKIDILRLMQQLGTTPSI